MAAKKHQQKFSLSRRAKSFIHSFHGIKLLIKEEHNARIHLLAIVLVIIAGIFLNISRFEWIAVVLAMGLVLTAEILNTSIENLADFISPERNNRIKKVKDLAAAGVFVAALAAFITGLIIFAPKFIRLFS
ncbi:diacylglycerol kinase family protein [Maribellus mangrovi]|uniref:diacylglycerol kinase family protein n=1 Tax=Maribellus mangrovi TaxID=3133146 RepID=UPI0030EEB0E0